MQARDIMTTPAITVTPDTPLRDVVAILLEHRISGVLVIEQQRVVGVLGDGDLLHRHEIGTDDWAGYQSWWQRLTQPGQTPQAYVRSHGGHVRDVMSTQVVSVQEDTPLATLATIFGNRQVRRVPVLRGEQLVGLVTRADMVRALARNAGFEPAGAKGATDDESIRQQLMDELGRQPWWESSWSSIFVQDGVVTYVGIVQSEEGRQAARVAAENIPGVRGVEDRRMWKAEFQPML